MLWELRSTVASSSINPDWGAVVTAEHVREKLCRGARNVDCRMVIVLGKTLNEWNKHVAEIAGMQFQHAFTRAISNAYRIE